MQTITDFINKKHELSLKCELLENEKWFLKINDLKRIDLQDEIDDLRVVIDGLDSLISAMQNASCDDLGKY